MAKAGAGDVLAGVITGLVAQGMNTYEGALLGVFLHACGGGRGARLKGDYSVLARDLIDGVGKSMDISGQCFDRYGFSCKIHSVNIFGRMIEMKQHNRVCAEIDLDAIAHNMEQMRDRIGGGARLIAVIKTDGYGHGAVPIAEMLKDFLMCGGTR